MADEIIYLPAETATHTAKIFDNTPTGTQRGGTITLNKATHNISYRGDMPGAANSAEWFIVQVLAGSDIAGMDLLYWDGTDLLGDFDGGTNPGEIVFLTSLTGETLTAKVYADGDTGSQVGGNVTLTESSTNPSYRGDMPGAASADAWYVIQVEDNGGDVVGHARQWWDGTQLHRVKPVVVVSGGGGGEGGASITGSVDSGTEITGSVDSGASITGTVG